MKKTNPKYKILPAIKPSVAINAEYQKELLKLLRQMRNSISYYCLAVALAVYCRFKWVAVAWVAPFGCGGRSSGKIYIPPAFLWNF